MRKLFLAAIVVLSALLTVLAAWWAERTFEPTGVAVLNAETEAVDLRSVFLFLPDTGQSPAELIQAHRDGALLPTLDVVADQVVPYQAVWAVARFDAAVDSTWQISSDIYGIVGLQVLVAHPDSSERILDYSARAPIDPGQLTGPLLRSIPFEARAGESLYLLAAITRGPIGSAALTLETPQHLAERAVSKGIGLAGFYALSIATLGFFLAFSLAMKSPGAVGYAVLLMFGLGVIAYMDGLSFRFLYPDHPQIHIAFGLITVCLFAAVGFRVAALALDEYGGHGHPTRRLLIAGAVVSAGCAGLVLFVSPEIMAPVSYVLVVLMFLGQFASVVLWKLLADGPPLASEALSAFCASACMVIVVLLFTGRLDGALDPGMMVRVFYAVVAIWIMAAVTIGLVELRRQHAKALANEVVALQQATETAAELLEAEQNYSRARDVARARSRRLATASHDMKQPIMSLRLTMDSIAQDQPTDVRDRLSEAFDYMEQLSQGYLDQTSTEAELDEAPEPVPAEPEPEVETFDVSLVLDTVSQMFGEEAISKGIRLRVAASSLAARAQTLAVMRILSNLVSNAVKYTEAGGVLVGARPRGGQVEIQVLDTGAGMTSEELERFSGSYEKGAASEGSGLGLSICFEIASANGLELTASSEPGHGTLFRLRLPRVCDETGSA